MEHYKELNKELIDANREMRDNIAAYQRELVLLRAALMEQQRLRVESESHYQSRIISMQMRNFREVLQEFTPNSGLLELLHDWKLQNESERNCTNERRSDGSKSRRSSQIVNEFRRSSAVHRRRSVTSISPTRIRSDGSQSLTTESSGNASEELREENDEETITVDNSEINENTNLQMGLQSIKEVSEVEAEDEINFLHKVTTSRKGHPLRDLNIQNSESIAIHADYVNVRRGKQHNWPTHSQYDSIEVARILPNLDYEDRLELENMNILNSICSEVDDTVRTLNVGSMLDVPCSTPLDPAETASNCSYACVQISEDTTTLRTIESAMTTQRHRLSRKCAPKSFVEPNLTQKLRNESDSKSTKKKKKKKQ